MKAGDSRPHLLTLPREIRNQIYDYLHRTLELRGVKSLGPSQVFVRLDNAPYPSLYSVHSRLCAEYLESGPTKSLSALILNRLDYDNRNYWSKDAGVISRDEIALSHVRIVTLRMTMRKWMPGSTTTQVIDALGTKIAELRVIRVNEIAPIYLSIKEELPEHANWATRDWIEPLPHVLLALTRIQLINCREIVTSEIKKPGEIPYQHHIMWQCRAHVYGLSASSGDLWTKQDVIDCPSPPAGYTEWVNQWCRDDERVGHTSLKSSRIVVWKEENCTEQDGNEVVDIMFGPV
ncbi:uncharacterized protein M421DRAFT_176840 [Didymella exigua CBS 183.55]|uniref:Uncharacterized protein n=1 Tax=Didymella exigua CBS 183.55 TaxID=1150837 RepID=A0A6A5RP73_9PLEO|nr:uncharacterized protein M421DRAFT_176840 [Didymella exigua CBS 183.55]KAF1927317.1 hypothetical protein M421DRAFT_176840 [Didymella exigua CBS 183.55]